ncbi:MAG: glucose-6-phosphate dehydrogenase [Desulfobulbus sp.]|jgi:glucose-6-phosphate 1-dehydrogenase|nr:glucose-6-phosphate dehydrogenase [Desulfobulbus sp.]
MSEHDAQIFLFGATGDLAAKKILPALQQWENDTPSFSRIWCLGRRPFDAPAYIRFIEQKSGLSLNEPLEAAIRYHQLDFTDSAAFVNLANRVGQERLPETKRLFFLAVKPKAFVPIASGLSNAGLFKANETIHQLLCEKPFGEDLSSAIRIQEQLMTLASEEQIYRIDHYLGKDMIRNILTIRFANRLFSECWDGRALENVDVSSIETTGVEERLEYYDHAGAINDMVQSHLLQMVALVAMAAPANLGPEAIRQAKVDVLRRITVDERIPPVIGQYKGYDSLSPGSAIETYVEATLRIDTEQWPNTRFLVRTGKKLAEKRTEIRLNFRPTRMCTSCTETIEAAANQLTVEVYPQEGVHLRFNSKAPGYGYALEQVTADYCHSCRAIGSRPEAYVKLLKDALAGDHTLFAGFEELREQWRIADQIRALAGKSHPIIYPPGTDRV